MAATSSASSDIDLGPFALMAPSVRGKIVTRMGEDLRASFAPANRAERHRRTAQNFSRSNFT
jgi:hypothetical protein